MKTHIVTWQYCDGSVGGVVENTLFDKTQAELICKILQEHGDLSKGFKAIELKQD